MMVVTEIPKIMIGNDDGIKNIGIDVLAKEAAKWGDIQIICPEKQQSARAKSLTFHKPIRIYESKTRSGMDAIAFSSSPADSILIHNHLYGKPDIVISGINSGDNTSIHSVLTSGTVAVSMEAGLQNIPSFAFSMDVPEQYYFQDDFPGEIEQAAKHALDIVKLFYNHASNKFWKHSLFLNINFPDHLDSDFEVELVELETYKYDNYLVERSDPKGEKYFWLWGDKRESFDKSKDSYKVYEEKKITVTPVSLTNAPYLFKEANEILSKKY